MWLAAHTTNIQQMAKKKIEGLAEVKAKLREAALYIKNDAPDVIGQLAVNHFKKSFENEGFTDKKLSKWAPRAKEPKLARKVLVGQGNGDHLADSIDYTTVGTSVIIQTDKAYAEAHNEGYTGTQNVPAHTRRGNPVKAHSRNMKLPQRQFIGDSDEMNNAIEKKIEKDLTKILS